MLVSPAKIMPNIRREGRFIAFDFKDSPPLPIARAYSNNSHHNNGINNPATTGVSFTLGILSTLSTLRRTVSSVGRFLNTSSLCGGGPSSQRTLQQNPGPEPAVSSDLGASSRAPSSCSSSAAYAVVASRIPNTARRSTADGTLPPLRGNRFVWEINISRGANYGAECP